MILRFIVTSSWKKRSPISMKNLLKNCVELWKHRVMVKHLYVKAK